MSLKNEHIPIKKCSENCLIILEQSKYNINIGVFMSESNNFAICILIFCIIHFKLMVNSKTEF